MQPSPDSDESDAARRRFAWVLAAIVVLATAPRLLLHELWRDEAWLWIVVTESRSLGDLFEPLARSGQGSLFPMLCYAARQFSTSPRAMQLVHLVLVGAAAFVFARWAPLERRERALFALGYFPFYEYAVISRHYVAGALLLWLACAAARSRRPALALGAAIGLLCQTTIYGYILAIAVAAGWLLDRWLLRRELAPTARVVPGGRIGHIGRVGHVGHSTRAELAGGLALGLGGALAGLIQIVPQAGTSFAPAWRLGWDAAHAGRVLMTPWRAFVPLPLPQIQFWNTNLLDPWPALQIAGGASMLALAVAVLWRRRIALAIFVIGAAGLLGFGYIKLAGVLRHHGHFWLLFVAAIWLGGVELHRRSWRARVVLVLLMLHVAAGAFASWVDVRHPFSNGGAAAELIRREGLDGHPLFGHRETPAATVALHLGRPLYAPSREVYATHPDFGPEQRELTPSEVRCAARKLARQEARDVVLVMSWPLPPWAELEPIGATAGAIQGSEDYHLYWLRFGRLDATAGDARCV